MDRILSDGHLILYIPGTGSGLDLNTVIQIRNPHAVYFKISHLNFSPT